MEKILSTEVSLRYSFNSETLLTSVSHLFWIYNMQMYTYLEIYLKRLLKPNHPKTTTGTIIPVKIIPSIILVLILQIQSTGSKCSVTFLRACLKHRIVMSTPERNKKHITFSKCRNFKCCVTFHPQLRSHHPRVLQLFCRRHKSHEQMQSL